MHTATRTSPRRANGRDVAGDGNDRNERNIAQRVAVDQSLCPDCVRERDQKEARFLDRNADQERHRQRNLLAAHDEQAAEDHHQDRCGIDAPAMPKQHDQERRRDGKPNGQDSCQPHADVELAHQQIQDRAGGGNQHEGLKLE
jgi:hypothetical protein